MFARIADAVLANRGVVALLTAILVVVGVASLQKLPIDAQPDISPRQVLVVTQAAGLGPLDIERFITTPLELALQGMPYMENLRSVSRYGLSVIYVRFADDVDCQFCAGSANAGLRVLTKRAYMIGNISEPMLIVGLPEPVG